MPKHDVALDARDFEATVSVQVGDVLPFVGLRVRGCLQFRAWGGTGTSEWVRLRDLSGFRARGDFGLLRV